MRLSDKVLGYAALAAILAIAIAIPVTMHNKELRALSTVTLEFDEVGALQPQDVVTHKGFSMGEVQSILWSPARKAIVTLRFDHPLTLREGCIFLDENFSLMGARRINLISYGEGDVIAPGTVIQGVFEPGIAEALHVMALVKEKLVSIISLVRILALGDSSQISLPTKMMSMLDEVEKVATTLENTTEKSYPVLMKLMKQADTMSVKSMKMTQETGVFLKQVYSISEEKAAELQKLISTLHATLSKINLFLAELENKDIYKALLEKKDIIESLARLVHSLELVARFISTEGLQITDSAGKKTAIIGLKNLRIFHERASEKAKRP